MRMNKLRTRKDVTFQGHTASKCQRQNSNPSLGSSLIGHIQRGKKKIQMKLFVFQSCSPNNYFYFS